MHIIIRLIILFIFVFVLLMLNIPQISENNFIMMKLYIFVGIFIFEFIVTVLISYFKRQLFDVGKIAKNSLLSALVATVAYSIYNDITWYNAEQSSSGQFVKGTRSVQNLTISVIITAFMAINYFLDSVFANESPQINDCLNKIYPLKNN